MTNILIEESVFTAFVSSLVGRMRADELGNDDHFVHARADLLHAGYVVVAALVAR